MEMVVCEEHKRELVDFNAVGSSQGRRTIDPAPLSGAA
jgi:hypothetical protein